MLENDLQAARRSFRIVFVCTANRFRSPLAAGYLRRLLAGVPVEIGSCGMAKVSRNGLPPLPETLSLASSSAVRLADHRTRWLGDASLAEADLVVGFERNHVAAAVLEGGAPREKTFLFTELVDLLHGVPPVDVVDPQKRIRALVAAADRLRLDDGRIPEVTDPFGRSRETYERVAVEIWSLTRGLVEALFDEPPVSFRALPRPHWRRSLRPRWRRRRSARRR
jgi:low molecular weight protein-tyrosine phosphatase